MKLSELIAQLSAEYLANGEAEVRMDNQGFPGGYTTGSSFDHRRDIRLVYSRDKAAHKGKLTLKETTFYDAEPYTAEMIEKLMKQLEVGLTRGAADTWAVRPHLKTK